MKFDLKEDKEIVVIILKLFFKVNGFIIFFVVIILKIYILEDLKFI